MSPRHISKGKKNQLNPVSLNIFIGVILGTL